MYNEEMIMDVEDFDEDIKLRKQLIEEAKQVTNSVSGQCL